MGRIAIFALFAASSAVAAFGQPGLSTDGPLISLYLPHGFPSDKVQVQYFLLGPFGGYGGSVQPEPNRQSVDFVAAVDGKPAAEIKVVAYLPGCEFIALDFPLAGSAMWRQLECKPLKSITVHGKIAASMFGAGKATQVEVQYLPDWASKFFGIADGLVPIIALGTVFPAEDGEFAIQVPDFYSQQGLGHGEYMFTLRDSATNNILASLTRENPERVSFDPPPIRFKALPN
jgi:hypothetical protein